MLNTKTLNMTILNKNQFPNGRVYFELGRRMFIGDGRLDNQPYIVHNNYIYTKSAKIYRFKETGLWVYDEKRYYSNTNNTYLMYNNNLFHGAKITKENEKKINYCNDIGKNFKQNCNFSQIFMS